MHPVESNPSPSQEMSQLHAATCLLMTRFISGHHCPKLAHVIVHQLQRLLVHPATQLESDSRDMYRQLLEHWQGVSSSLAEQTAARRRSRVYH